MNRAQRRKGGSVLYTPGDVPTKHAPAEQSLVLPSTKPARRLSHAETRARLADLLVEGGMPREKAEATALDTSVRAVRKQGLKL